MKISSIIGAYEVYRNQPAVSGRKISGSSKKDDLKVSSRAKEFQLALKSAFAAPDIREDKVEKIANQIENDVYNVTAEDVADKILSNL